MSTLRTILLLLVPACLLVAFSFTPALGQGEGTPDATEQAELTRWFESQSKPRQELLKRRLRALKTLPKHKRDEYLKAAREGRPVLNDAQRDNLAKLRKLSYLERVRLFTLASEIEQARRANGREFTEAEKLEGKERAQAIVRILQRQRAAMFLRNLSPEQHERLRNLPPEQRLEEARKLMAEQRRESLEALAEIHPRVAELKVAAESTDKEIRAEARKELRQVMRELGTLDQLLQRLDNAQREEVMATLKEVGLEKGVEEVRKALRDQWTDSSRKRRPGGEGPVIQPDRPFRGPDNRQRPPRK